DVITPGETKEFNIEKQNYVLRVYVTANVETGELTVAGGTLENKDDQKVDTATFINRYTKATDYTVDNKVEGDGADIEKLFSYSLTITPDASTKDPKTGNERTYQISVNGATATTFTAGHVQTFQLKHNEKVEIKDVQIGSKVSVTESDNAGYTVTNTTNLLNSSGDGVLTSAGQFGKDPNTSSFLNTLSAVTPTGIIINNLPYILLVVVALGGFAMYFVSRRRHNEG
ncbi:MAG: hypothetical protein GX786_08785, partial [Clostridiales bacterium]|nr:hypothetical protein [Clostridiales bacterium]